MRGKKNDDAIGKGEPEERGGTPRKGCIGQHRKEKIVRLSFGRDRKQNGAAKKSGCLGEGTRTPLEVRGGG